MDTTYCGPAPVPETWATQWNFDPVALGLCALLLVALPAIEPRRRAAYLLGTLGIALLFISPLCGLTAALFSVRVVHHVILAAVLAPLFAWAMPVRALASAGQSLSLVVLLHAAIFWFWHAPSVYDEAVASAVFYWLMQVTIFGSAFWMWQQVFHRPQPAAAILALLATVVQMGMLGALLTFQGDAIYATHAWTTQPFGLSPLEDQQLAGLIMWVPAAAPYLVVALIRLLAMLKPSGENQASWSG
ncbi:cytochrome c oxidase assembly protein [Tianweitania sp. BSSL-BM11]|uniref:Cytochrome c oxidase assembly protein n=1 Tax=Tianweitania aestuarii TaxID=2814886 RepID=A0ABS5RQJ7_9HYPH|nr:cytochrome c oxidase assembly protein [Tianweitania aestuarii]MBS9719316.1 cytochrome c oxidase assembly protein [Tianweitania aestuarii]